MSAKPWQSKITPEARDRCAHNLQDQLARLKDQADINLHLEHDASWTEQARKLKNAKGWDEPRADQ
jgi:hypothetical protein